MFYLITAHENFIIATRHKHIYNKLASNTGRVPKIVQVNQNHNYVSVEILKEFPSEQLPLKTVEHIPSSKMTCILPHTLLYETNTTLVFQADST